LVPCGTSDLTCQEEVLVKTTFAKELNSWPDEFWDEPKWEFFLRTLMESPFADITRSGR
jgi:hypothetical protein